MVVLDTNVVIEYLRGNEEVIEIVNRHASSDRLSLAFVTEYELLEHERRGDLGAFKKMVDRLFVYHSDDGSISKAAEIYKALRSRGGLINELDILIAGVCIANGQTLITRDKDFSKIAGLETILI